MPRLTEAGHDAVGFFYYAGHGAANSKHGENYLIPIAAPMTLDSQLVLFGVKAGDVIDALAATRAKTNFAVLDSCRDVPLEFALKSAGRGLRPEPQRRGMPVAFATDPGRTATDSGVYAEALAAGLERPGAEALEIFRAVRRKVPNAAHDAQFPWHADGLVDNFYFMQQAAAGAKPVEAPNPVTTGEQEIAALHPVEQAPEPSDIRYENAAQRLLGTFVGNPFITIQSIAISPDGCTALSGGADSMKLWDVATRKEMKTFTGHVDKVYSVALSPDGHYALSGSCKERGWIGCTKGSVKLWMVSTGQELRAFTDRTHRVTAVAFSPDGRLALSSSADGTMKLWDVPEWTQTPATSAAK